MNILLTNIVISGRSGTEIVIAEIAYELRRRGHEIVVYSPTCGKLADELRFHGIIVVDRIANVPFQPEIIHGHHNVTLAVAITHFPNTPSIFVCHDFDIWHDSIFLHHMIKKYIAVDQLCMKRLQINNVPFDKCLIINNAVNTEKYLLKEIKNEPQSALVLSKGSTHFELIKKVCNELNIHVDAIGYGFGKEIDNLHEVLQQYDIVFATARMALEAAACGCSVIICDHRGYAGNLNTDNWDDWYQYNLGRGILKESISEEKVKKAILDYSKEDLTRLAQKVRSETSLDNKIDIYEQLYKDIINFQSNEMSSQADANNFSEFLEEFLPSYNGNREWHKIAQKLLGESSRELLLLEELKVDTDSIKVNIDSLKELFADENRQTSYGIELIAENVLSNKIICDEIKQDIGVVRVISKILRPFYLLLKKCFMGRAK